MKRLLICCSCVVPLHAAGDGLVVNPLPVEAGPRSMGLGNAFTAIADDATASAWNPAGMTILERIEVSVSGGWYSTGYDGSDHGADNSVDLDHVGLVLPFTTVGVPQSLALTWQREYDFTTAFTVDLGETTAGVVDTRQQEVDQEGALTSLNISYAVEPHPSLALGITYGSWDHDLTGASDHELTSQLSGSVETTQATPFFTIVTTTDFDQLNTVDSEVVAGNHLVLGAMWRPSASWTIGLAVRPAFTLDFADHARQDSHNVITTALTIGGSTTVTTTPIDTLVTSDERWQLRLPTRIRIGSAYRFDDARTLSMDVGWTRWQEYQRRYSDGSRSSALSIHHGADEHDDGFSVHLGYEQIKILPRVALVWRCGASISQVPGLTPAPSPDQPELSGVDTDTAFALGAGMGFFLRRVLTDVGVQYRWMNDTGTGYATAIDESTDLEQVVVRCGVTVHF